MTPEGYLQDLARTLSDGRNGEGPSQAPRPPGEESHEAPLLVREALEGRDLDEVLPNPSTISASFHGRALRETVARLGLRADVRWGCGGLPLETLDALALQVPFGGGVAIATPSGLVKFIATLAHVMARQVPPEALGTPLGASGQSMGATDADPGFGDRRAAAAIPEGTSEHAPGATPADLEFVELLVAVTTPGARVRATVPARSDPASPLAGILRNVAERFAMACPLAAAVLEPPRLPLWSTTRLGAGVEVKRLLPEARELMTADIVAMRLASDVEWNAHPGFAVWGIDLYLGGLALVESLQGRPRKAERGFVPALSRRNLVRTIMKQAAGSESERAFALADTGAQALAMLWDRNRDAVEARLQPR